MTKPYLVAVACTGCLALAASGSGCDKDKKQGQGLPPAAEWQAPPPGGEPGAAGNPHAGAGMDPHGGMDPHAGMDPHGGMDPHAGMDPHGGMAQPGGEAQGGSGVDVTALGLEPPDPDRQIDPDNVVTGTIKPTSATKAKIRPEGVIYISVKPAGPDGKATGAPLAVERLPLATWPLWFQLTERNAMIAGTKLAGDVVITAWVDHDQDAISKQVGDVIGSVRATIPAKDLTVVLDRVCDKPGCPD